MEKTAVVSRPSAARAGTQDHATRCALLDDALRAFCAGSRVSFRSASPRSTRPGHEKSDSGSLSPPAPSVRPATFDNLVIRVTRISAHSTYDCNQSGQEALACGPPEMAARSNSGKGGD